VLFDMDGVVTDTAAAHAAAWRQLFDAYLRARAERFGETHAPFDPERDYRALVDGKPRYDGVRDFLAARGIALPDGQEDDPPGWETVCALGNRKERYFHAWLERNGARAYPDTLTLLEALREAGMRTGVFSASRNAEAVLRSAGALHLFDAKLDGADLAALGLPGKPDPAMMLEIAARLSALAERTAVVEDAVSGVRAAVQGGFGLVIGIDRDGGRHDALRDAGAHLVVPDAARLRLTPDGWLQATPAGSAP
jgi:HAD superfamily hydrolase (TIGR01509 family)